MRNVAGSRLPFFSNNEYKVVINAFDFIGLNHYTSYVSNYADPIEAPLHDLTADIATLFRGTKNETPTATIVPKTGERTWLFSGNIWKFVNLYPGKWLWRSRYGTLHDVQRIDYLAKYMASTLKAIRNGADVRGYSVWSCMDLYEIFGGYKSHYGLVAVDFDTGERKRQLRRSAHWYSDVLKKARHSC